jgi:hypothetical protein
LSVVVGWLDQVAATSTHTAGGGGVALFAGAAANQSLIRLPGWLPRLKVLSSESPHGEVVRPLEASPTWCSGSLKTSS